MSIYKFKEEDIFVNTLRLYPKYEFTMYSGTMYINNQQPDSGSFTSASLNVPSGYISLYEMNNDKLSGSNNFIYPFITKNGSLQSFATVSTQQFSQGFSHGDIITGSYPMSSSLYRNYYSASAPRKHMDALRNTMNHYQTLSQHYEYSSSVEHNYSTKEVNLISIPSIFYGKSIKKGTVDLRFYVTGTLVGQLVDKNRNGELIQQNGDIASNDGKVAGVVLYNEGFVVLTGSWNLHADQADLIDNDTSLKRPAWVYWGSGITGQSGTVTGSHTSISFQGDSTIPTITMYAHAPKGELNHSNNPTFIQSGSNIVLTSSSNVGGTLYAENDTAVIKNTVYSPYDNNEEAFKKNTYISKVAIYDENMNVLGVAKVAKPVKKTEDREFSFKLKIDI